MAVDDWEELQTYVNEIAKNGAFVSLQGTPRAKLDIALARRVVEQMQQSTNVIYPALGDLSSEIKRHREALVAAAASSDKSAKAIKWLTFVLAVAACLQVAVMLIGVKSELRRGQPAQSAAH